MRFIIFNEFGLSWGDPLLIKTKQDLKSEFADPWICSALPYLGILHNDTAKSDASVFAVHLKIKELTLNH